MTNNDRTDTAGPGAEESTGEAGSGDCIVAVSEPAIINNQEDLDIVVGQHLIWISDVLNPRQSVAAGRANFKAVDLRSYSLQGLDLRCADFSGANLTDCDLRHANLSGCSFAGTILQGADLRGARLNKADFTDADLSEACMDQELPEPTEPAAGIAAEELQVSSGS